MDRDEFIRGPGSRAHRYALQRARNQAGAARARETLARAAVRQLTPKR